MENDNTNSLEQRIAKLEDRVAELEKNNIIQRNSDDSSDHSTKSMSIKEYIIEKQPKDDVQRTLVIAAYLEAFKDVANFTAEDLKQYFKEARLKPPINVNDKINLNIKKGWLMDAGKNDQGRKIWNLTISGEDKIKSDFREDK